MASLWAHVVPTFLATRLLDYYHGYDFMKFNEMNSFSEDSISWICELFGPSAHLVSSDKKKPPCGFCYLGVFFLENSLVGKNFKWGEGEF